VNTHLITTPLGDIEYTLAGKGIPVLFLHGGHSNCKETLSHKGFDRAQFQRITPSRPGYGQTPLNGHQTPRQAATRIIELLHALSLKKVVVYGISAGGPTAIALAATYPDRVHKLILASAVTKPWLDPKEPTYKIAQWIFHPRMEGFTWGMVRFFSKIFPTLIAQSFYPQFSKRPKHPLKKKDVQELIAALKHYRSNSGFLNDIDQQPEPEALGQITCPTLIVHSKTDASVSFAHAEHAHEQIPHSTLLELDNEWGHLFWIGDDAEYARAKTRAFLLS